MMMTMKCTRTKCHEISRIWFFFC